MLGVKARNINKYEIIQFTAAVIIFVLAFFVRIYRLNLLPLNYDELHWSLGSIDNINKFAGIPIACFYGHIRVLLITLIILTKDLFSSPVFIVRFPSVIIGSATVILIYKLAKEMYGRRAGLISSLLLCILPWHIIQSRTGVEVILTPLFGCLIALVLFKSVQKRSNFWFLLFCLFLSLGSFYTYEASLSFVPIFLVILLCIRKNLFWLKLKTILIGILVFSVILLPLLFLLISDQIPYYLKKILDMYNYIESQTASVGSLNNLLLRVAMNFKNNVFIASKVFFFSSGSNFLYGPSLNSPLLISWVTLFIGLFSIFISLKYRQVADRILLIWFILGCFGFLLGVKFFQARYAIIILPPALIFIARFIAEIFNQASKTAYFKRRILSCTGALLCGGLVLTEISQLVHYYQVASTDLEECRLNSYGCLEAAQYLMPIPNIESCRIIEGSRMTVVKYLNFLKYGDMLYRDKKIKKGKGTISYYVLWAPETHPKDYWDGLFRNPYEFFKQKYPDEVPIKTIYYPNGQAAIHIFRVEFKVEIF